MLRSLNYILNVIDNNAEELSLFRNALHVRKTVLLAIYAFIFQDYRIYTVSYFDPIKKLTYSKHNIVIMLLFVLVSLRSVIWLNSDSYKWRLFYNTIKNVNNYKSHIL